VRVSIVSVRESVRIQTFARFTHWSLATELPKSCPTPFLQSRPLNVVMLTASTEVTRSPQAVPSSVATLIVMKVLSGVLRNKGRAVSFRFPSDYNGKFDTFIHKALRHVSVQNGPLHPDRSSSTVEKACLQFKRRVPSSL